MFRESYEHIIHYYVCLLCALCVTDFGFLEKVSGSEAVLYSETGQKTKKKWHLAYTMV